MLKNVWPKWLTADRITIFGFFLVGFYAGSSYACLSAYILIGYFGAIITDFLDGFVARTSGVSSRFGRWIDPIRDRLILAAFFWQCYYWNYLTDPVDQRLAVLIIFLELSIWLIRVPVEKITGEFVQTNLNGKFRQAVHTLMMSFAVWQMVVDKSREPLTVFLALMFGASFVAFVSYARQANRVFVKWLGLEAV